MRIIPILIALFTMFFGAAVFSLACWDLLAILFGWPTVTHSIRQYAVAHPWVPLSLAMTLAFLCALWLGPVILHLWPGLGE